MTRLFYGHLKKKTIKKLIIKTLNKKSLKNTNILFLKYFESRIDTVLYRAKFSSSLKEAQQIILHKKVLINNKTVNNKSYILTAGDLITINPNYKTMVTKNLDKATLFYSLDKIENQIVSLRTIWPIPPKHLIINYKTMQIIFGTIKYSHFSSYISNNLNLEKILTNYYYH